MTVELVARSVIYVLAALAVIASAVWWGWELRERLALKLEYFRITNRRWVDYDDELRRHKGRMPLRAELHDITVTRQSDK